MSKVFIGVGHGGSDPGAVGYVTEKEANLNIALACKDYLETNGVEVLMSRYMDEDESLNEKIAECNQYNPDLCLDIHNNAGGGDGFEIYHTIYGGKGKELAQNIETEVIAIGQNSRGLKTKKNSAGNADYFGFIRDTKAPAVICEGFFVDNAEDVKIADTLEEQKKFGRAYARGILKTLGKQETVESIPVQEYPYDRVQVIKNLQTALNNSYDCGLAVDGIVGPATNEHLRRHPVKIGNNNELVRWVQDRLVNHKGYSVGNSGIDGIFGTDTQRAIRDFQRDNGLTVDGIAGINTNSILI